MLCCDGMYDVTIRDLSPITALTLDHKGPYRLIAGAFQQLGGWLAARGLMGPATRVIGIYYDSPAAVAENDLRSKAGFVLPAGTSVDISNTPYNYTTIKGGPYAVVRYKGPYQDFPRVYQWLFGEGLSQLGRQHADAPPLEEYLNNPGDTPPSELLTDICIPVV